MKPQDTRKPQGNIKRNDCRSAAANRETARFFRAFAFAVHGIRDALIAERNMKIHFAAGTLVFLFNLVVRPPSILVAFTVLATAMVVAAELVNTAVEHITNRVANNTWEAFAKTAKDAAAGAVLVLSFGAFCVAIYLLVSTYPWHWRLFTNVHGLGAVMSLAFLCGLCAIAVYSAAAKRTGKDLNEEG